MALLCLLVWVFSFSQEEQQDILVQKTNQTITIDGSLNEPIWNRALDNPSLIQKHADRFEPDSVTTLSKILYNERYIYIGVLCYDAEPDSIAAQTETNDADIRDDDSVFILVDSRQDSTNFTFFGINFIGTRVDGKVSKDGQTLDVRWNGAWEAASQKTQYGWSVEIAFERSNLLEKSNRMGLRLSRIVPRLDSSFRTGPLDPAFEFDQLGQLNEVKFFLDQKRMEAAPFVLSTTEAAEKYDITGGLDFKYAFSQQSSIHMVANPDFATVEPDQEQFNLTPFEFYLPEKRSFFLRNAENFEQPIRLFYSKRIGDIYGGLNLRGKIGAFEFTGMSAQRKKDNSIDLETANFSALRLKSTIKNSFTFGLTAVNKIIGQNYLGTVGADADIRLSKRFRLSGQWAYSYGDYDEGNTAFFFGPTYQTSKFHFHIHYIQIGEHFGENANHVGYVPDDNRREIDSGLNKTFEIGGRELSKIEYTSHYNVYWGFDDRLRSWQIDQGLSLYLTQGFVFRLYHTQEYKYNEFWTEPPDRDGTNPEYNAYRNNLWNSGQRSFREYFEPPRQFEYRYNIINELIPDLFYEVDSFRNHRTTLWSEFPSQKGDAFGFGLTFGKNFGAGYTQLELYKTFIISQDISVNYRIVTLRRMSGESPLIRNGAIHVFKARGQISENFNSELFFQYNSVIKKFNIHWVFGYTISPTGLSLQLVYQKGTAPYFMVGDQDHTLFLKILYMF